MLLVISEIFYFRASLVPPHVREKRSSNTFKILILICHMICARCDCVVSTNFHGNISNFDGYLHSRTMLDLNISNPDPDPDLNPLRSCHQSGSSCLIGMAKNVLS